MLELCDCIESICTSNMVDGIRDDRIDAGCVSGERAVTNSKCRSIDASDQVSKRRARLGYGVDRKTLENDSRRLVAENRVENGKLPAV